MERPLNQSIGTFDQGNARFEQNNEESAFHA
jgi:hypothetical protein